MEVLVKASMALAKSMNKLADSSLPERLVEIVKIHGGIAAASALIPIPGADIAASAVNIWTMYVRINKELDLPFSENILKSVAAGVATNLAASVAGLLVIGSAVKFFPGIGTVAGAALIAATAFSVTIVAGIVYMRALTAIYSMHSSGEISEASLKAAAEAAMKDKGEIKKLIKEMKSFYKK